MIHESGSIISSKEVEGELHRLQKGKHFKKEDKEMGKKKKRIISCEVTFIWGQEF